MDIDDFAPIFVGIAIYLLCIFTFCILIYAVTHDEEGTIYQGPEGHCSLEDHEVTCYNIYNREVCKYRYNDEQDGHFC